MPTGELLQERPGGLQERSEYPNGGLAFIKLGLTVRGGWKSNAAPVSRVYYNDTLSQPPETVHGVAAPVNNDTDAIVDVVRWKHTRSFAPTCHYCAAIAADPSQGCNYDVPSSQTRLS